MFCNRRIYFFSKRMFDIILSLIGLTVLLPISAIIIFGIMLQDGPPIFFCDTRVGKRGKIFRTYKFRSMIKDAEKTTGSAYASKDDPRVTPLGRILRVTALDEIPQLINIFKGDMSFVGPRPEKENYAEIFRGSLADYNKRHTVLPGLTGLAQVYLKYDSDPQEKLNLDLLYAQKANFWWDLQLIAKSILITLKGGWEKFEERLDRGSFMCHNLF